MSMQIQPLKGKVVLVTGAGSDLGEATAYAFADAGCMVDCVDLNQETVEGVNHSLGERDVRSIALPCDVSYASSTLATVNATVEQLGRLDIAVNGATIDHTLSVEEMSVEQWDQVIGVNLRGSFLFAKAAWSYIKQHHASHIINIASTAAPRSWANAPAYHALKRGLIGFGQGRGVEGRQYGIRVTTMIPGGMNTHFFDRFADQGISCPIPKNMQSPATVTASIVFAAQVLAESNIQEMLITPSNETS